MLTKETIKKDYVLLKQAAIRLANSEEKLEALDLIAVVAKIAYEYNFIASFDDEELDSVLDKISCSFFTENISYESCSNRIVFYDYFAFDNRGLTQQYLRGLISLDYEILYIIATEKAYFGRNDILNEIEGYQRGKLLLVSDSFNFQEKAEMILAAINDFKPSKAFIHSAPWDVVVSLVFTRLTSVLHRYFINLTDQAFWLGKNLIDTNFEYRNFGFQLSENCRKIDISKLQLLPYYPILPDKNQFLGLPNGTEGKVIGISGGSGYKFLGDNGRFYNWIKYLLNKHDNFCFILVGAGSGAHFFNKRIERDNLSERFILIEDRTDLYQLLQRCNLFIGSYPFSGGLMSQIAVMAGLPIVSYTKQEYLFNYLHEIFINDTSKVETFTDENKFLNFASKLIEDEQLRKSLSNLGSELIITQGQFELNLEKVLQGESTEFTKTASELPNIENTASAMSELFIEIENKYNPKYYHTLNHLLLNTKPDVINGNSKLSLDNYKRRQKIKRFFNFPIAQSKYYLKRIYKLFY